MWPRKNRWPVFCQQGISAACAKLAELIAHPTALAALTDVPPPTLDTDENAFLSASLEPSQAKQELAACKEDIVSLIQAMFHEPWWLEELDQQTIPGFESFGDVALAFELPSLYEALLENRLKVCERPLCLLFLL